MKIIHVIRDTVDWNSLNLNNYFDQPFDNNFVKKEMYKMIKKWDAILEPNYFKFRSMVANIAYENHNKLNVDIRFKSSNKLEQKLKSISKPYIVLFVDDDDWHNPDVTQMLKHQYSRNKNLDAIVWDHYAFLTNYKSFNWQKNKPYFLETARGFFHTNNYALTDRFWDNLTNEDIEYLNKGVKEDLCYGHHMIDRRFKNLINYKEVFGKVYSVSNKTICSYSSFLKRKNDLIRELQEIVTTCQLSHVAVPPEINWAKEEINKIIDIYKILKFKKIMQ